MNPYAEELLEGVNLGDFVCVRYGTDTDQQTYTGEVIKITEFFLHLRPVGGRPSKIRLDDSLRALNWVEKPKEEPAVQPEETKARTETTKPAFSGESNAPAKLAETNVQTEPTQNSYHISRQIMTLPVASSFSFSVAGGLSLLQTLLRQLNNTAFKSGVNGIMDSLSYAVKTHSTREKYHNLKARTLAQWDNCSEKQEYEFFYLLLAHLSIFAEDYSKALEPLVRVRKFSLAAYIASSANDLQSAELFSLCALLAREDGAEITQYTSEICVKRKDSDVLRELLKIYHDDHEVCERVAACAYNLFQSCGGTLKQDITPYDDGYQAATKILEALPDTCKGKSEILEKWKEFDSYSFPEKQTPAQPEKPKREIGGITKFEAGKNKNWGFSGNNFFYISQVRDDTESALLLRKLLFAGCGEGLEISYFITASPIRPGSTTLTDIDLTEKGFEQAQKRVGSAVQYGSNKAGYVAFYNQKKESGAIQANGQRYSFQISSIIDPYLRKFYETSFVHLEDQHVIFEVKGQSAQNIRWNEKKRSEGDFASVRSSVTDEQAKAWSAFLAGLGDQETTVKLPSEDPYSSYPYTPLEEDAPIPNRSKMVSPLSWPLNNAPKKQDLRTGEGSSASSAPQSSKSAAAATPKAGKSMSHNAQLYVNKARKMRLSGDLQGAEVYFKKAIEVGGFNEAVMSDFIALYQQMGTDESLQQAVRLIEQYEDRYAPEKAVNIKIQVYDKLKDYETLIGLYEQAFQLGRSVTTKSHNLFRLVGAYVHLKDYEAAFEACKRWEQFYRQNQYSSDAGKMKNAEPNIARYKAICYYHMAQVEEAKKIATDLVRLNPADKVALAILDGSLEDTDTMEKGVDMSDLDDMDDFLQDEETEGDHTRLLSQFVRDKIQNTDLNTSLKARHVENEKYISTKYRAREDVQKLSRGLHGMSAKNRCESLFAACRLLEIIHQSTEWKFNFNSELIYSGRAMAFWADYTVSQSSTMDSPRMGYLYALKVLRPQPKKQTEQTWVDSYNRYIKSYFVAQKGSASSLESYIAQQAISREKDKANTDAFLIPLTKVLIPEFLVGMMQLYDALDSQEAVRENLLADLYHKNQKLRADLIQQLQEKYQCDLERDAAQDAFKTAFKSGCSLRAQKLDALRSSLQEAANILTLEPLSAERLSRVDSKTLKDFLNSADSKRLNAFHHLLNHYQDYFGTDFDAREECLRSTLAEAEGLINTIQAEPTDVSYEMFLPILTQISVRLREAQDELYLNFQPNIKLTLGLHAFRTPNEHGWLQIEITVENAQNYQTAEDFSIDSVGGAEIEDGNNLHSETIPSLRGGIPVGLELTVKVAESALQAGSFTMQVNYSYQCRTSVDQEKRYSKNSEIMVVIHTDNTGKLTNPYSRCMNGQPVQEKAMFYGRDEQIEEIVTAIGGREDGVMNYGSAIAIYGQTRTGKSSVLFHLQHCLANRYPDQVIIWDMGNIGEITGSDHKISFLSPFLYYMLYVGYQALMNNPLVGPILSEKKLKPPLDEILTQPDIASVKFTTYMKQVNAVLKENNCIIVLVLDEFTYLHGAIKSRRISPDFMKFWKALLQDYCIFSVVAGQDDMIEFMHEYQNEFACMSALKLNYLDENSAKQLIREPLKRANQDRGPFDENDLGLFTKEKTIESIYKLTAGSAYLINVLCSNLVDYVNERGAYKISDALFEAFLRERVFVPKSKSCFKEVQHFESHLQERGHDELNEANKEILLSIARNSKGTGYARLDDIDCKEKSPYEIKMLVERLEKRDVLVREVQAGRDAYSIQVKLLEKWLISTEGE